MKFGLEDKQYLILEDLVIRPLLSKKAKVFIFGSRARGTHHPFSDIDILFKEDPEHPLGLHEISRIREDIEDSNLVIKVDLVRDQDLAKSYRPSVEKDMIQVTL